MAKTYTTNYGFTKDDPNDPYNVDIVNDNLDAIDRNIKAVSIAGGGVKTVRLVIGSSTSGWSAKDCDYLCDGTADDVEINAAIQALPTDGGEIVILDGTYNITAEIIVSKSNVSIVGNGSATKLIRSFNNTPVNGNGVIRLQAVQGCNVENLQIDGNKTVHISVYNNGIYLIQSTNSTIIKNSCDNVSGIGIVLETSSSGNAIIGNSCNNCGYAGIHIKSSSNNMISSNGCYGNYSAGIYLESFSSYNAISNNVCRNSTYTGIYLYTSHNNNITGNICNNNGAEGLSLGGSRYNTLMCNNLSNNEVSGITLSSNSTNNNISNNNCLRGTGTSGNYTASQYTILLSGSGNNYNLIIGNLCMGKAPTIDGGTGITVKDNKWNGYGDVYEATITTTWTGSAAPYTQDVTITGLTAYDMPDIVPVYSATLATAILEKEAWNMISKAETGANKITFTCFEDKPTTAINIKVRRG